MRGRSPEGRQASSKINRQANRSSKCLPRNSYPFFSQRMTLSHTLLKGLPLLILLASAPIHPLAQWKISPQINKKTHLICLILLKLRPSLLPFRTTLYTQHGSYLYPLSLFPLLAIHSSLWPGFHFSHSLRLHWPKLPVTFHVGQYI